MFKGNQSTNFKSELPKDKVYETITDSLETIGSVIISERGHIKINASRFSGFAHDCEITGVIRDKDGKYFVELEWESTPKWVIIIIAALCLFGVGLALLVFPILANNDIQKKATSALDNIRFDFK